MIFTPPRHGKSELVSRRWPARYLGKFPDRQFISCSYGKDLAADFGRDVRNIIQSQEYKRLFPDVTLAADSSAKDKWHTNKGGVYLSSGVGGGITGRGADILSIDDPVKDRAEAESLVIRDGVWNWYTSTAYTRLMKGGAVVVTMTRWHEDDLAGRLLAAEETGGDKWTKISLPAFNADGSALWPERYPVETLRQIEHAIGPRDWGALYEQDPRPLEGGLFKPDFMPTLPITEVEAGETVRAWDFAATERLGTANPDWTVGVKLRRTWGGKFVVLDVTRLQGAPETVLAALLATANADGHTVQIGLPQDPGQAGKWQVADFTRRLAGYVVKSSPESGDKSTRAAPCAAQCNVGNLAVVAADWNRLFREELRSFPGGTKDDQVDALSRAFGMLVNNGGVSFTKIKGF